MAADSSVRALADLLLRFGGRQPTPRVDPSGNGHAVGGEYIYPTKAFKRFLSCVSGRESPVLLDLGPVVGSNVTFFGDRLDCKIFVENIFGDLERFEREKRSESFSQFLSTRFQQGETSVDGILCWDLVDFLDRSSAQVLAKQLSKMLKPGGALLGFFATVADKSAYFTKYTALDDGRLQHQSFGSQRARSRVLLNRDIIKMFDGLSVSDSFLLQNQRREILFRKPPYLGETRPPI